MSCCKQSGTPEFARLVSPDKGLAAQWRRALSERGEPEVCRGDELRHIGMPVGGICAGQLYLSGDGRLWHWDLFKGYGGTDEPIDPRGHHYAEPMPVRSPLDQGFALQVQCGQDVQTRRLDASGFSDLSFEGRYPMGCVRYYDADCPVEVSLTAFSPFIPLDEENSSLPATVMEYVVSNRSHTGMEVNLAGWLENKICHYDDEAGNGLRRNRMTRRAGALMLGCHAEADAGADPSTLPGYGDMTLALLDSTEDDKACAMLDGLSEQGASIETLAFKQLAKTEEALTGLRPFGSKSVGAVGRQIRLAAGERKTVRFVVAWHFPAYNGGYVFHSTMEHLPNLGRLRRHYAKRFKSSQEVAGYLAANFSTLAASTRLWVETWYDSTLPYWFLNRTFLNASTLATQTCHWFDTGRFYAWEGVDCCQGTCQHVWQYAQAVARLFPRLERHVREHVDYGVAFKADGSMDYRAEGSRRDTGMKSENDAQAFFAADGQCGTILRVYREHCMAADAGFLTRIWLKVKKSIQFMMTLDANGDGLLEGPQFHTLDTSWHGEIPWISSLYLAALAAGKQMAKEMGDADFAKECGAKLKAGRKSIVQKLFNGEYFVHAPDPTRPDAMNLTQGCYIDQVFGQGYAMQLGLPRVIPKRETLSALHALWKYNYAPDVGPYRAGFKEIKGGRWFAMPGEGGLIMCSWPKNDCDRAQHEQKILGLDVTSEGYLNECMSGFEHQVASHMIAEGLVEEGLAIIRTIHERYHPSKRNPYNEVECSDHYSRAMASYGVYINICGFQCHGPKGYLSFSPKLSPENFRAAFTSAEGWGTFRQTIDGPAQHAQIHLKYGTLYLKALALTHDVGMQASEILAHKNGIAVPCHAKSLNNHRILISFKNQVHLAVDDVLTLDIVAAIPEQRPRPQLRNI